MWCQKTVHCDLVELALGWSDLLQSLWLFSVGNSVLRLIILHNMCGEGYHLHMVTWLKWCSKHEVEVVTQFLNAQNESAAEIISWSQIMQMIDGSAYCGKVADPNSKHTTQDTCERHNYQKMKNCNATWARHTERLWGQLWA